MELFSIKIRCTFQLVSTSQTTLIGLNQKVKRLDISVNFGNARTSEPLAERQNLTHWFGINMELGKPIYLPQRVSRPQGMPNGM